MAKKSKWLCFMMLSAGTPLCNGCLGAFWQGLWQTGWTDSRWLDLALDIVKEATIYNQ